MGSSSWIRPWPGPALPLREVYCNGPHGCPAQGRGGRGPGPGGRSVPPCAQPASLSFPRRGWPGFEDLSWRQVRAAPGLLGGQLLQSGQRPPGHTHPDPVVSVGGPRCPWGGGGPRGHSSDLQTRHALSSGTEAKAPTDSGGQAGGPGEVGWAAAQLQVAPDKTLAPTIPCFPPPWSQSGRLVPSSLEGPLGHCVPHTQVSLSAWCPAKPSPTLPFAVGLNALLILCGAPSLGAWSIELPWKVLEETRRSPGEAWSQRWHQTPLEARGTSPAALPVSGTSRLAGGRLREGLGVCGLLAGAPEPGPEENKVGP